MNDRIILNTDNFELELNGVLDEIENIRNNDTFTTLFGNQIKKVKQWERLIKQRQQEPFNIVVVGDFKRGKSSLINAILQTNIVPTNVLPETVTINKIIYGEQSQIMAILKNGKKAKLDIDELNRNKLENVITELSAEIDYIEIQYNHEILKEISITDTPGIGDIFKEFDETVANYLSKADAILYVISARTPLSQTEKEFLSSIAMPYNFSRFFVILNMIDTLETIQEIDKINDRTVEIISHLGLDNNVFPLSALDEYCRISQKKRPSEDMNDYLEKCFEYFRDALNNDIIMQKEIVRINRIAKTTDMMICDIIDMSNMLKKVLSTKANSFSEVEKIYCQQNEKLKEKIEKELDLIDIQIDEMCIEAKGWMREFLEKIKVEITSLEDSSHMQDLQKHFQFYLSDIVKQAAQSCIDEHSNKISSLMKETIKSIGSISDLNFENSNNQIGDSIADVNWTSADSFMTGCEFLSVLTSSYLFNNIIVYAIAGFVRQAKIGKKKIDFLKPILENFEEISTEIIDTTNNLYKDFKVKAKEQLEDFYAKELEKSTLAIDQAKDVYENEKIAVGDATNYLNKIANDLNEQRDIIKNYI